MDYLARKITENHGTGEQSKSHNESASNDAGNLRDDYVDRQGD
jgi:hypothetical protein